MSDLAKATQKAREFRQREQAILDCALQLFMEQGEDRVTVEMIADRVGIGKGTIYKHFETKNEIYLLLMIRYEEELADLFRRVDITNDKEALMREYFRFRVQDPDKYLLFDRLESKLMADKAVPQLLDKLHAIRASNFEKLTSIIKARIEEQKLADVPPEFHICAAWALAHGAAALSKSAFYKNVITDQDAFFDFLLSSGVRMGNRTLHEKDGK
ncbi:MAG TPA: TetR/AcrR family transcriptional regulator [Moraxellaceae bacterium]|nr:TetR/AcrR family transcriptional regulator [Moraxellaceae bacterium]